MHEIAKYVILTEIQEQCLNPMPEPLIGPGRPPAELRLARLARRAAPAAAAASAAKDGLRPVRTSWVQPALERG